MENYINACACRGTFPPALDTIELKSRRFLVAKLFSSKHDARVLVAPTGFGKSCLAAQYASLVFSFWHVFWLDCQDLRFLRALNDNNLDQLLLARDEQPALVVFDDVPVLNTEQSLALANCVQNLLARNCEVLVCSTPVCAQSFLGQGTWNVIAQYKSLLVQSTEQEFGTLSGKTAARLNGHCNTLIPRIPAIAWEEEKGTFLLVRGFVLDELSLEDVLTGLFLFGTSSLPAAVVQAVSVQGAGVFSGLGASSCAVAAPCVSGTAPVAPAALAAPALSSDAPFVTLEQSLQRLIPHYPYFSYNENTACYETFDCSDSLFEQAILPLCAETLSFMEETDAMRFAQMFARLLLATNKVERACLAMSTLLNRAQCTQLVAKHALFLLLSLSQGEHFDLVKSFVPALLSGQVQGAGLARENYHKEQCLGKEKCGGDELQEAESGEAKFLHAALNILTQSGMLSSERARELCSEETCVQLLQELQNAAQWFTVNASPMLPLQGTPEYEQLLACIVVACWAVQEKAYAPEKGNFPQSLKQGFAECFTSIANSAFFNVLPDRAQNRIQHALQMLENKKGALCKNALANQPSCINYHVVPTPSLRVNLWGAFSAQVAGRTLDARNFKRKKSIVLLAILATDAGREFNRDYLAEKLWPESSLCCARRNLYAVWSELRAVLRLDDGSCPYLIRSGASYRLDSALVECDTKQAELLCACLQDTSCTCEQWNAAFLELTVHFSGDPLSGAPDNDCLSYYGNAMKEQTSNALMSAAQVLFDRGEVTQALHFAKAVIQRAPDREDACELAMKAQIQLGQSVSALNTFFSCQRYLADQLGVDPSPSVYALYEKALGVSK